MKTMLRISHYENAGFLANFAQMKSEAEKRTVK